MRAVVKVPVTVKCRIGVDDQDACESLFGFIARVSEAGCRHFVVHARKAWLKGLSPKENRDIPPLDYPLVYRLKRERPDLTIVINGGVASLDEAAAHLDHVDGVMLGRAAYHEPGILGSADARIFGEGETVDPFEAVERYRPYVADRLAQGAHLAGMTRHMLGLFHGRPGARGWRRLLSEGASANGAGLEVYSAALAEVTRAAQAA
jgi:tRNA-dihydrouridine synthase A